MKFPGKNDAYCVGEKKGELRISLQELHDKYRENRRMGFTDRARINLIDGLEIEAELELLSFFNEKLPYYNSFFGTIINDAEMGRCGRDCLEAAEKYEEEIKKIISIRKCANEHQMQKKA